MIAHVALNGTDPTRFKCTDPELMALDDTRGRLYVTCQGNGTVDVLDTAALVAGTPAEVAMVALPLPTDVPVPTLTLSSQVGGFGARVCAAFTSNAENQANTLYAKGIAFFPNPNLEPDGAFSTTVPLPGGGTGDAVHGEQVFDSLACATCHPEPMFTIDQFRVFTPVGFSVQSTRMREVLTPVHLPLRARCQDANRPTGTDGSTGFSVPTLRGIWDTFPLLMSGAAGFEVTGPEPTFTLPCTPGSSGCCTQLRSPLNPAGTPFLGQQLTVSTKDAMRALLTAPLAVPGTGHGAALALAPGDLDDLIAYLRSL